MKIVQETASVLSVLMVATMREYALRQISNARKKGVIRNTTHYYTLHTLSLMVVVPARPSLIEKAKD